MTADSPPPVPSPAPTPAKCTCGHSAGSHSSLRFNCMATTAGTHATRCECKAFVARDRVCSACGCYLGASAEGDGERCVNCAPATHGPASDAPAPPREVCQHFMRIHNYTTPTGWEEGICGEPLPCRIHPAASPAQEAPLPHPVRPHTPGWGVSALERMQARAEWAEQSAHTRGQRLEELRAVLGWLESVLRPGTDPVEVYLAGLRQPGQPATAFQVEVVPASGEGSFSVNAPTLQDAFASAASRSPAQEATPPREQEQDQG